LLAPHAMAWGPVGFFVPTLWRGAPLGAVGAFFFKLIFLFLDSGAFGGVR